MGKLEPALVDFKIALTRRFLIYNADSELASIYLLRGAAYMRAERINDALADYNNCVLKASGDPRSYISRAEAYERLGEYKQALADYERAQKCIEQYAPKHRPTKTMDNMPEWKERMAQSLYEGRARVYDALKEKKLADADRVSAKSQVVTIK
jgi:tetratricopeptide (TPR) repeat protein